MSRVEELQAHWRRAEERLYATALGRPDVYELSLELVRRTVEHLRGLGPGTAPLLAAAEQGAELVAATGTAAAGVDLDLVAQAALALRHREVAAELAGERRVRALRDARDRGEDWVVLEESGDAQGSPLLPYRRLEAHVSTGRALLVTTSPDATYAASLHAVEGLLVDLATGDLQELRHARASATLHADAAERERRVTALRADLTGD